jgi:hypothetical protein
MGGLHSGGGTAGGTLKGFDEYFASKRAGRMVLHRAFWQVQWPA